MEEFNTAIVKGMHAENDDPEVRNWVTTTFGKMFAGAEVDIPVTPDSCPVCHRPDDGTIEKRRINTAYVDDDQNWCVSCAACFERTIEYYDEMWAEYYSMVMPPTNTQLRTRWRRRET